MRDTNNSEQDSSSQVSADAVVKGAATNDTSLNEDTAQQVVSSEALQRIMAWKQQYQSQLSPSPLEDITQLSAKLELTHAHPSGIAQLFASGKATLKALFRDAGMLRAAGRRLDRQEEKRKKIKRKNKKKRRRKRKLKKKQKK